ncbi:MAG: radical SAM protein [Nanoarchaeota archaeon]
MRIALIFPPYPNVRNYFMPLGIAYLASVLEKGGHTVKIFDFALITHFNIKKHLRHVFNFKPNLIGFSVQTFTYKTAIKISHYIKKKKPELPIVFGGPHPTYYPEKVIKEARIEYVIYGEGEYSFRELADVLENKGKFSKIKGLVYKENGKIIKNSKRPLINNLDELPFPARHLFQTKKYFDGKKKAMIITSRGCPYNCIYCCKGIFGNRFRQRSPKDVIAEIKSVKNRYKIDKFFFIDELFTFDKNFITKLCNEIIRIHLNIKWEALSRVDTVDLSLLEKMKEAGCNKIHYGIESGDPAVLKKINKNINLGQIKNAIKLTKQVGIKTDAYFILGLPGDNIDSMGKTIDLAYHLSLDNRNFSLATALPGNYLWEKLQKNDSVIEKNFNFRYELEDIFLFNGEPVYNFSNLSNKDFKNKINIYWSYILKKELKIRWNHVWVLIYVIYRLNFLNVFIKRVYNKFKFQINF